MTTQPTFDFAGMTDDEARVWDVVRTCKGRGLALTIQVVADRAGVKHRRTQQIVQDLIRKRAKPIGSSSAKPPGYYVITDAAELDEAYRSLRNRGIKCLVRAAKLKGIALEEVFHQARLELEDAA